VRRRVPYVPQPTPVPAPCVACREGTIPWRCDPCNRDVADYCRECHAEIRHGRIGPPPRGRAAGGGTRIGGNFHHDEDMNRRAD